MKLIHSLVLAALMTVPAVQAQPAPGSQPDTAVADPARAAAEHSKASPGAQITATPGEPGSDVAYVLHIPGKEGPLSGLGKWFGEMVQVPVDFVTESIPAGLASVKNAVVDFSRGFANAFKGEDAGRGGDDSDKGATPSEREVPVVDRSAGKA